MKRKTLNLVCLLLLVIVYSACKKGDVGPQGETGPQGSQGSQGVQGPSGTANVIYTDWFTATPYIKDTIFSMYGFNYTKAVPAITQEVLDSGTVLTYGKLLGYNSLIWPTGQIAPLPINLTYTSGSIMTDTWSALSTAGNVKIRFVNDHNYYSSISTAHQFRVIVIPGGQKGSRMALKSYEEICREYKIPY